VGRESKPALFGVEHWHDRHASLGWCIQDDQARAEGIIPLVSNSPLIWWQFKLLGPYVGSNMIGATEWTAALLLIVGYARPKAGLIGALITTMMFFITSTMLLSTPDATIAWKGLRYMNNLGLFLFKDVISLGVSLYFISYYGRRAMLDEARTNS
jgi:uncharacterized membrane protein YkgB